MVGTTEDKAMMSSGVELEARTQTNASMSFHPGRLLYLTFADTVKPEICLLAASVFSYQCTLYVLGWNHSETYYDQTMCNDCENGNEKYDLFRGRKNKMFWTANFLSHAKDHGLHDNDIIIFTDAYDILIQRNVKDAVELFMRITEDQRGVVFNGEPECGASFTGYYASELREKLFEVQLDVNQTIREVKGSLMCSLIASKTLSKSRQRGPNYSLNSGGYIGDLLSLQAFFRRVLEAEKTMTLYQGDQIIFQIAYMRYPELNLFVDTNGMIFHVLSYLTQEDDLEHFHPRTGCDNNFLATNTSVSRILHLNVTPVFIHFPGFYKGYLANCSKQQLKQPMIKTSKQYFYDVDRQKNVMTRDICSSFG